MQEESVLNALVYDWAREHLRQHPVHIFLVVCTPERVLRADPPEQAWIADIRLAGGATVTLLLGQRCGHFQVERGPVEAPKPAGFAG